MKRKTKPTKPEAAKPATAKSPRTAIDTNAREVALGQWVSAIAEGQTMRGAAVPLVRQGISKDMLVSWCRSDERWAAALEAAQATKVERMEAVLRRIATTDPGDISEDPGSARVRASTAQWLLSKWDRDQYGDRARVEQTGKDGGPIEVATKAEVVRYELRVPRNKLLLDSPDAGDDEAE